MGHMIEKKEKKTAVFIEPFGRHQIFAIYEVDASGEKIPDAKVIVQFGKVKALEIIKHFNELEEFVNKNK